MFCHNCSKEIDNNAVVCPNCGVATINMQAQTQGQAVPTVVVNNVNENVNQNVNNVGAGVGAATSAKSKMVTLLLCIFLGYFGAHRFYVGKTGTGLIWLFTLGICGFGWIYDIVMILLGNFTDKFGLRVVV